MISGRTLNAVRFIGSNFFSKKMTDATRFWKRLEKKGPEEVVNLAYATLMAYREGFISEAHCDVCMRHLLIFNASLYDEYESLMAPLRPFSTIAQGEGLLFDVASLLCVKE